MQKQNLTGILSLFGIESAQITAEMIGNGLINQTWKITTENVSYVLQKVNTHVFTNPQLIAENLQIIKAYLSHHHRHYLLVAPLSGVDGSTLVKDKQGRHFRLFHFVPNSHTINFVSSPQQAFEAAKQFAKFTKRLEGFTASQLNITLPHFHDLSLRFRQLKEAVKKADTSTLAKAKELIKEIDKQQAIVATYESVVTNKAIPLRVCHHDTKISNVLFDENNNGLCVIDLDTVMPGYIISDVGDMLRTYLSPANEEEQDMSKIIIRKEVFVAIMQGYLGEMSGLTEREKELLIYSGKFMMYMQAVRFLTDFLNNNIYYQVAYPLQNWIRAKNQLTLLHHYKEAETELQHLL